MRDYTTFDLETDPFEKGKFPKAFAGGFYDGKRTQIFWGDDCCRKVIAAIKEHALKVGKILVYAHNGGKFDFHFVLRFVLDIFNHEDVDVTSIGARIVAIKTPLFELRDSYSIIPRPLKAFGDKKEIDIQKLRADVRDANREEIIAYLKQDCVALYDGLTEFFKRYGCKLTLASTAFEVGKKQFGVEAERTNINYDEQFRKFYFAGRVQFWSLGKHGETDGNGRFNICDINSAFPWAMLQEHWFGGSGDYVRRDKPPKQDKEQCFYEVTCDSDGALPWRETNGGVSFPIFTQRRIGVTGWELFAALELGLVRNVEYHTVYQPKVFQHFREYVNHFYALKKNAANVWDREFAKLFLNSYYGKFALNPREFRDIKITLWGEFPEAKRIEVRKELAALRVKQRDAGKLEHVERDIWREPETKFVYEFAGKGEVFKLLNYEHSYDDLERGLSFWQVPSNDTESKKPMSFYNVATAASITGCVRAFLMRSLAACKGVLYCDTDSIIAADTNALSLGDELGQWKLEKTCDAVWIGGKKLYCAHSSKAEDKGKKAEYKTASKGVRLSVPDLISVCEGEERSYSFDAPNYSPFSKPGFTTRKIVRADKRKTKSSHATNNASDRRSDPTGTASGSEAPGGNQPAMPRVDLEQPVSGIQIPSPAAGIDGRN